MPTDAEIQLYAARSYIEMHERIGHVFWGASVLFIVAIACFFLLASRLVAMSNKLRESAVAGDFDSFVFQSAAFQALLLIVTSQFLLMQGALSALRYLKSAELSTVSGIVTVFCVIVSGLLMLNGARFGRLVFMTREERLHSRLVPRISEQYNKLRSNAGLPIENLVPRA